jgi:hypothetical protein
MARQVRESSSGRAKGVVGGQNAATVLSRHCTAEAIPGNGQSLGNGGASVCLGRSSVDDDQVVVMDAMMGKGDRDGVGWKSMGRCVIART